MPVPASLLTHVKTIDLAAAKVARAPLQADLAAVALTIRIAPERTTATKSIANSKPRAPHPDLVESLQQYADTIKKFGHGDLTADGACTPRVAVEYQLNDT